MTQPTPPTEAEHRLLLTNDSGLGRLSVDMQSFFEFSFWMAEELEDLVAKQQAKSRRVKRENIAKRATKIAPQDGAITNTDRGVSS